MDDNPGSSWPHEEHTMNASNLNHSSDVSLEFLSVKNIILSPILAVVIVTTILGNILVIASVAIEKSLRTPSNALIFSLAISDLIVGLIVMPLRSTVVVFGHWPFRFRCDLPLELNKLSAQASVLHLVAIAIDRYFTVSQVKRSAANTDRCKLRIGVMLALVWLIPALYVCLPYLGWHDRNWKDRNRHHICVGNRLVSYRLLGLLITFYMPIPVIIIFYYFIYQIASESARHKRNHRNGVFRLSDRRSGLEWDAESGHHRPSQSSAGQRPSILKRLTASRDERERKVAHTLWLITLVFLLCWSPFMITYSVFLSDDIQSIHVLLNEAVIWSGLCNSAMNPIIYAYFVPTFRIAFKKIIFRK